MEVARLYHLLQINVDQQFMSPGFVLSDTYGMEAVNVTPPAAQALAQTEHLSINLES